MALDSEKPANQTDKDNVKSEQTQTPVDTMEKSPDNDQKPQQPSFNDDLDLTHIPEKLSWYNLTFKEAHLTRTVVRHKYPGRGTEASPYSVEFLAENDETDPMSWPTWYKWLIVWMAALSALSVTLASTTYTGGIERVVRDFNTSILHATLGVSLFVLGFAFGPLLWAPLSELVGRRRVNAISSFLMVMFLMGSTVAQTEAQLYVLRMLAGALGSAPITNSGGIIADMFNVEQRGLAMSVFSMAPFLGPALGPIIGGFLGMNEGWRWVSGLTTMVTFAVFMMNLLIVPETFAVRLLSERARKLSELTGKVYKSKIEIQFPPKNKVKFWKSTLSRPFVLLVREPIVIILSLYQAIVYGILYMLFGAFPIVYHGHRGWNLGVSALPFIGVMLGMFCALIYTFFDFKSRYLPLSQKYNHNAPPETRLPPSFPGALLTPIGLFIFAWTNSPNIHWFPSVLGGFFYGAGVVLVFLSLITYLVDSYTIFAASVLAASSVLRSLIGMAFPLFTNAMFTNVGIHWGASIAAFLALAAAPFPFLFYKYGQRIRLRCKYAKRAAMLTEAIHAADSGHKPEIDIEGSELENEAVEEFIERHISRVSSRRNEPHHVSEHESAIDEQEELKANDTRTFTDDLELGKPNK